MAKAKPHAVRTLFAFEAFDPLEGEPPNTVGSKLRVIASRARRIVATRNRTEIIAAADIISWLTESESFIKVRMDAIRKETQERKGTVALDGSGQVGNFGFGQDIRDLICVMDRMSLEGISDGVPNVSWPELFAVFSLGIIDGAVEFDRSYGTLAQEDADFYHQWIGQRALDAMEAVCTAEGLLRHEQMQKEQQKARSDANQRAALKSHQATNNLKREFIHFYLQGNYSSYAEAARRFYEGLEPEKKKLLKPTNAVRTLTDALSAHLRRR